MSYCVQRQEPRGSQGSVSDGTKDSADSPQKRTGKVAGERQHSALSVPTCEYSDCIAAMPPPFFGGVDKEGHVELE